MRPDRSAPLHRIRHVALRLGLLVASCSLALAGAEGSVRFLLGRRAHEPDPPVSVNSHGFREREFGPRRPGTFRIAVIGDSFTWGLGVEQEARFSNRLEHLLGPGFEVLNFGLSGNNLPEHVDTLEQVLTFEPDFVLLQLFENDFETPDMIAERPIMPPLLPQPLDHDLTRDFVLYHLLEANWYRVRVATGSIEGYPAYIQRRLGDPNSRESLETSATLRRFIRRAQAAHVGIGGVLFPAFHSLTRNVTDYPFKFLDDRIAEIFAEQGAPLLNLYPFYARVPNPTSLQISDFDAHPNEAANATAADAIAAAFRQFWRRADGADRGGGRTPSAPER